MIRSISVANLGPFKGEQHVDLKPGILSVEGRYVDKPGESNRSGKSAFIDLIRFGYFGVHRHRSVQNYIHRGADTRNDPIYLSMEVEDPNGDVYHIIREFDYNKQGFTTRIPEMGDIVTQMKQPELQRYIEDKLLGCSYNDAIKTWMVLQDDARGLMNLSVADRKRFLLDLFSPTMFPWDSYFSEASARYILCKTRQSEIMSRINNLRNRLYEISDMDFSSLLASTKAEILELQQRRDKVVQLITDLEATSSPKALDDLARKVAQYNKKLNDMHASLLLSRKTLDKLEHDVERLNSRNQSLADLQTKKKKLEDKAEKLNIKGVEDEYGRVYDQHKELSTQLSLDVQKFKQIDKFRGLCPITHEDCPSGSDIKKAKAALKKAIESATEQVDALQTKLDKLVAVMDANDTIRRDMDVVQHNIAATEAAISALDGVAQMYEEHRNQNKKDEKEYVLFKAEADKLSNELEARRSDHDLTHHRRIRELKQEQDTITKKLDELDSRLTTLIADQQRKDILEQDLADSQKEYNSLELRERALRSLKPMLSQDGIPFTNLLSSIIDFEAEINKALVDLGDDLLIDIEPYTITNSRAPICQVCGYEFGKSQASKCPVTTCQAPREYKKKETLEVRMKGRVFDVDFDEDSGGGKQKVAMAIRLALFNVLRDRGLLGNVDMWCLDEIFAPLSDVGKFNMLNSFESVCNQYNIRQLFLVTHTDISSIIPPAVIIQRSDSDQESRIIS